MEVPPLLPTVAIGVAAPWVNLACSRWEAAVEVPCVGSVLRAGSFKSRASPVPWAEEGSPRMLLSGLLELVSARGRQHLAGLVGLILEPHVSAWGRFHESTERCLQRWPCPCSRDLLPQSWRMVLGLGTGTSSPRASLVLISRNPWQPWEPSVSC